MDSLATRFGGILASLRSGIARCAAGNPASAVLLHALASRIGRMATSFDRLFARFRAGTLPSQTSATPRPSRAGQTRAPRPPRIRYPSRRQWLFHIAQPPAALAQSHLRYWMAHPDLPEFLAAAPQAGRLLRPLCRLVGLDAQPGVPAALNLPNPPPFRPPPPPPPLPPRVVCHAPEVPALRNRWHWERHGYRPPLFIGGY